MEIFLPVVSRTVPARRAQSLPPEGNDRRRSSIRAVVCVIRRSLVRWFRHDVLSVKLSKIGFWLPNVAEIHASINLTAGRPAAINSF